MTKREEAILRDSCKRVGISYADGLKLASYSRQLHNIAERKCNGFHSYEKQREKWNKTRENNIKLEIFNLLAKYNEEGKTLYPYHQGDPRGAQLYIINIDEPHFVNKFCDWVSRHALGTNYYGTNVNNFIDCCYNQYGVAF